MILGLVVRDIYSLIVVSNPYISHISVFFYFGESKFHLLWQIGMAGALFGKMGSSHWFVLTRKNRTLEDFKAQGLVVVKVIPSTDKSSQFLKAEVRATLENIKQARDSKFIIFFVANEDPSL